MSYLKRIDKDLNVDSFSRLRVSTSRELFTNKNVHEKESINMIEATNGAGASISFNGTESSVSLNSGTDYLVSASWKEIG